MSGPIRSSIAPAMRYLRDRMAVANELLANENKDARILNELRKELVKLTKTFARLEGAQRDWRTYLGELEGDEFDAESDTYENFKFDEKHFMDYVEECRQLIDEIEIELADHSSAGGSVHEGNGNVPRINQSMNNGVPNPPENNAVPIQNEAEENQREMPDRAPFPASPPRPTPAPRQMENGNDGNLNGPRPTFPRRLPEDYFEDFEGPRFFSTPRTPRPRHAGDFGGPNFGPDDYLPIRMPPFQIPKFDGNRLSWPAFWQAFETSIDTLRIAPVQKLTYLISHLEKNVLPMIAGYSITNDNYELIVKVLKEYYGDGKAIREALQSELIHLSAPSDNVNSLQHFFQSFERICRQLENMNNLNKTDGFLLNIAKSKLPKKLLENVVKREREMGSKWNLDALRKLLGEYISLQMEIERCVNLRQDNKPTQKDNKQLKGPAENVRSFAALGNDNDKNSSGRRREIPPCIFCGKSHWSSNCDVEKTRKGRIKILQGQKRCFRCLRADHMSNNCQTKKNCPICNGTHHRVICPKTFDENGNLKPKPPSPQSNNGKNKGERTNVNNATVEEVEKEEQSVEKVAANSVAIHSYFPSNNLLMSIEVDFYSPNNSDHLAKGLILFDSGSQVPLMSAKLIEELNPPKVGEKILDISVPLHCSKRIKTLQYSVRIACLDGGYEEMVVHRQDWLDKPIQCVNVDTGELQMTNRHPDLMVSIGEFWRFFRGVEELSPYFYKIHTTVGPILCGRKPEHFPIHGIGPLAALSLSTFEEASPLSIAEEVANSFWDLEGIGITDDPRTVDDEVAEELFLKSIKRVNGRFQVKWPWKEPNPDLPSNYNMAFSRLKSMYERLQQTPEILGKVNEIILGQLEEGIIEETAKEPGSFEHFLPHHVVITHKIRQVYAANAHVKGKRSLNDCLFKGKIYLPDLAGMLLRFRLPVIALWADIQAAFLQIELAEEDRNVVKFIWVRDIRKPLSPSNVIIYRFRRVPFGVISSPYLLMATIRYLLNEFGTKLAITIKENIFMDNTFIPCENVAEALENYKNSKDIFSSAKMNLREFISNSKVVNESIPLEDRLAKDPKILGIKWDIEEDLLKLDFPKITPSPFITRRIILKELNSNFDPLGFKIPCLLKAKLMFQKSWDLGLDWDEPMPNEVHREWTEFTAEWAEKSYNLRRRVMPPDVEFAQLHSFVDASKDAYCTAIYLVVKNADGYHSNLIFSKNRLKPRKKEITIPRMELLGMVLGIRELNFVKNQLRIVIAAEYLWTDSQPILGWLNSVEKQSKFVANRVEEIRKNEKCVFKHVPTQFNPADLGTRGISIDEWRTNVLWWNGPEWLQLSPDFWPVTMTITILPREGEMEVSSLANVISPPIVETIVDFSRFNDLYKLLRTVVIILKFIKCSSKPIRKLIIEEANKIKNSLFLSAKNIMLAENLLIRMDQRNLDRIVEKRQNLITFTDEMGLKRLRTRLDNSQMNYDFNFPVILDNQSEFVRLLILEAHERVNHLGPTITLNEFSKRFWIPHSKRTVGKILRKCLHCIRITSPPFSLPIMPALPEDRVNFHRPFANSGIDYLGPSVAKINGVQRKFWIVIITCFTTRAVDLSPVLDLTTFSLLHILRRFVARRGEIKNILSDNGTQFKVLSQILSPNHCTQGQKELNNFLIKNQVNWRRIPELSPWRGAVYERLIALVKGAFKRTLGKKILDWEEVNSFTAEVEAVLNGRPLTWISEEPDNFRPLRPMDFLVPGGALGLSPSMDLGEDDNDEDFYLATPKKADELRSYWKSTQRTLDFFQERWKKEYLLMLRKRNIETQYIKGPYAQTHRPPKVNEVVLIEGNNSRNLWKMGRIISLAGSEGQIRTAKLMMTDKKVLTRPINLLYPLEVSEVDSGPELMEIDKEKEEMDKRQMEDKKREREEYRSRLRSAKRTILPSLHMNILMFLFLISFGQLVNSRPINAPICRECSMECLKDGIIAKSPNYFNKVEICCNGYEICLIHKHTPSLTLFLPQYVLIRDYSCWAHFWMKNGKMKQTRKFCLAQNPCKIMDNYFDWIINPECFPIWSEWIYGIFLIFGLIFCYCSIKLLIHYCLTNFYKGVLNLIYCPFKLVWKLIKKLWKKNGKQNAEKRAYSRVPSHRRRIQRLRNLVHKAAIALVFVLCLGLQKVSGDNEIQSLTVMNEECYNTVDGKFCEIEGKTLLTLLPNGQPITLLLKNKEGELMGEAIMKMESLGFQCLLDIKKFFRSYRIVTETVKSCPFQDNCNEDYCESIRPEMKLKELANSNNWPGLSFCRKSCSFFWCGCGPLVGSSCLFYRPHAIPQSEILFKFAKCNWRFRVDTNLKIISQNLTMETNLNLYQGMTTNWDKFSITLVGGLEPPSTLFNKYFLIGNDNAAIIDTIESHLDCSNEIEAMNFENCTLSPLACAECFPMHNEARVDCVCQDLLLEKFMENPEFSLPLSYSHYNFRFENNEIIAETKHTTILLWLTFRKLRLSIQRNVGFCQITPIKLEGCYNCPLGSIFRHKCQSELPMTAEIHCGNTMFTSECDSSMEIKNSSVSFDEAEIERNCTVFCGKKKSFFIINGHLFLLTKEKKQWTINTKNSSNSISKWNFFNYLGLDFNLDWMELFNFIFAHFYFFIIFSIITVLVLFVFVRFNPTFRLFRLLSRKLLFLFIFLVAGVCRVSANDSMEEDGRGDEWVAFFGLLYEKMDEFLPSDGTFSLGQVAVLVHSYIEICFESHSFFAVFVFISFWFGSVNFSTEFCGFFPISRFKKLLFAHFPYVLNFPYFLESIPLSNSLSYTLAPQFDFILTEMPTRIGLLALAAHFAHSEPEEASEKLLTSHDLRLKVMEAVRKFPIWTTHLGNANKLIRGDRISACSANLLSAFRDSIRRQTVAMYYRQKGISLKFASGPCLVERGGNGHVNYYPLELLEIEFPSFDAFMDVVISGGKSIFGAPRRESSDSSPPPLIPSRGGMLSPPTPRQVIIGRCLGRVNQPGREVPTPRHNSPIRVQNIIRRPNISIPRRNFPIQVPNVIRRPTIPIPRRNTQTPRRNSPMPRLSIFTRISFTILCLMFSFCSSHSLKSTEITANWKMSGENRLVIGREVIGSSGDEAPEEPKKDGTGARMATPPASSSHSEMQKALSVGVEEALNPGGNFLAAILGAIKSMVNLLLKGLWSFLWIKPQSNESSPAANRYDPLYPGFKGETLAAVQQKPHLVAGPSAAKYVIPKKQHPIAGPSAALYEDFSSDEEQLHSKKKRQRQRRSPSSEHQRRKKDGRARSPSVNPHDNIGELANSIGRAVFHVRGLAAFFRREGYSSHSITTKHWADGMQELKNKLIKDGRL